MAIYQDEMSLLSGPFALESERTWGRKQSATPGSIYPLTKSQEGMWTEFQSEPTSTKYNLTLEWDLLRDPSTPMATIADITRVIIKLTARHAALRSMFSVIDGKPHMEEYGVEDMNPEIRVVYRENSTVNESTVTEILRKPFVLLTEFPARWVILQDSKEFRLYLIGHHIVVDGQSMANISGEFIQLLEHPESELPLTQPFYAMHMSERAWARSQTYLDNQKVLLSQVRNKNNAPWPTYTAISGTQNTNYRQIDSWCTFQKSDLETWSQMFKTSWFRVATTLVGLLVIDKSRPQFGKDEVVSVGFGSRPKEMASCVGQFANALPISIPLWHAVQMADGSFKALVSAVGKNISAVKKAELFPAVDVVQSCRSFNIDYVPPKVAITYSPKLARSECRLFPVEGSWDLFFCFLEYENDVKLGVIYNPRVFPSEIVGKMKLQFDILSALSKVPGAKLADMLNWLPIYPKLPPSPSQEQPNPMSHVHHWFDAHADSRPEALALLATEKGESMTYGELYTSSEKKASFLVQRNVRHGDNVLINLRRGFAIIEWILAILKCGAAFVYLDPDFTERQKSAVVSNCKPSLVIDEVLVDEVLVDEEAVAKTDDTLVPQDANKLSTKDADLAYIIYTSGSTGEPKGVMVEHGSLATFVKASTEVYEVGFGTRVLQLASFSFDASILEWTSALCTGSCLCFAESPKHLVGEYLAEVIQKNEINFMQITPTALETLPLSEEYPTLRQISIGGEAPSHEIFAKWHPRVNLVNSYGPTEAAVAVSFNQILKSDAIPEVISAGLPSSQVKVWICGEGFGPILRPGLSGEICLSGPQLARGYSQKPDITARSFATHATGVRMYRTGDRGMVLEDGSLLIMGRIDRELKVRGFRIAPEEVEATILDANVGVQETSVQISQTGLEILAFVSPSTVSSKKVLESLKSMLPAHKVPSRIFVVDNLPKNVSGKIDHKAVRALRENLSRAHIPDETFVSDSEDDGQTPINDAWDAAGDVEIVTKIWQDVLRVQSSLSAEVNFFDIGGHSLLVPKLHDKLKVAFPSKAVRLVDLFHKSTIKSQALLFGDGKKQTRTVRRPAKKAIKTSTSPRSESSTTDDDSPSILTAATSVSVEANTPAVSIIGMAGRFPGARNVDEFYQMLLSGGSGIKESENCDERQILPGNMWVPRAGVLDNIEDFDHEFWNLSEEEATEMDPQQRLFLEVAYEAFVDAGIDPKNMDGGRIGIFVGSANHAYHLHTESVASDPFLRENRGFVAPSMSARTAYHLNIRGPSITIQTNCASSTVALSQAFDAIRLGRCDMALVGGVSVQLYEGGYITQKGQIFSPRGVCNPFDSRADGTVPADAVTAVVLKRYSAALSDSTLVYANILGTGVGSDGALDKAGYQVPSPRGQADVIKSAWNLAELSSQKLKYAEIHGSGTPIGDALELEGLSLAHKELGGNGQRFVVGSTKGNIGNAQHASGLVSLIKLCKSMQSGVIPATKGLEQTNKMINPDLPVALATSKTRICPGDILAVSASGWGGVNSHVVVGFPDAQFLKRTTILVPDSTFNRNALMAPRLNTQSKDLSIPDSSLATLVFTQCASKVLGIDAAPNTDLKQHGLDSKSFVALVGFASNQLSGPVVGVRGLLRSPCTPLDLGEIYCDQLKGSQCADITSAMIQSGGDTTILILPGSGGSCASSIPLIEKLHKDATVIALEHHDKDPSESHYAQYHDAIQHKIGSKGLIIVGMSLGGLSALRVASLLIESSSISPDRICLVALDSPSVSSSLDVQVYKDLIIRLHSAIYIGAAGGQSGSGFIKAGWLGLGSTIELKEWDCQHHDLWSESHASQTAEIINDRIEALMM